MSLNYLIDPNIQLQDKSGHNNVNGFLRVYIDNTDDRAVTYKDFNGTFNQADIRLDNNGRAVVIVDDTMTYRLEVYDRDGAMLWTQYPVKPSNTVINYGINNTYVMNADVRGTPDEIDVTSTIDQQTGFKTFFIKLSSTVKNFLYIVSNTLTSHGDAIENLQNVKKDKQTAVTFNGSATKTVKKISQNENGKVTVEFEDIDLPPEVPNVNITSPNGTLDISSSTDQQTNTKTFEIDVKKNEMQHWLGGYGPTYTPFPGDNMGHTLGISKSGISSGGIDYVGDFIDHISTCPYPDGTEDGYIYLKPGLYYVNCIIRYQQDPEALSNTLDEVLVYTGYGNANESLAYQLDSSGPETTGNRHNLRVSFIRHATENDGKILYFAPATPVNWKDAYIQKLEIVKLDSVVGKGQDGLDKVYHDSTLSGDGTSDDPLSVAGGGGTSYTAGTGISIANNEISTAIEKENGGSFLSYVNFGQATPYVPNDITIIDGYRLNVPKLTLVFPKLIAGAGTTIEDLTGYGNVGKEISVSNPLPQSAQADAGKVLTVDANGSPGWSNPQGYSAGNMVSIVGGAIGVNTSAGITDIQLVSALPANPVSTVLYLIPEAT